MDGSVDDTTNNDTNNDTNNNVSDQDGQKVKITFRRNNNNKE
jgi:PDZ domain-containing secreted protein